MRRMFSEKQIEQLITSNIKKYQSSKLYAHYITFDRGEGEKFIYLISTDNLPLVGSTTANTFNNIAATLTNGCLISGNCYNIVGLDSELNILGGEVDSAHDLRLFGIKLYNGTPTIMTEEFSREINTEDITEDIFILNLNIN